MSAERVGIIGAGLGGLAAAIRLAARGVEVHLFEQHDHAGGKANTLTTDGYRFDTGPSLFTMRAVFAELFAVAGRDLDSELTLKPLDPGCHYFYPDGTELDAWADPQRFAAEVEAKTDDSADSVLSYLASCKGIYDSAGELFLRNSLHSLRTYLKPEVMRELLRPWRIDPFRTMNQANERFFNDPRTVQLFNRYATYNGSDPFRAPATLNIITYVEHCLGAFGVEGGIYSIVEALVRLARSLGVELHFSSPVERILVSRGRAVGMVVAGEERRFDAIISNADVSVMYRLLGEDAPVGRSASARPEEASTSALVFLWGMRGTSERLGLHQVFFSHDYRAEFADIFGRDRPPVDPTVYLHISSKVTPSDAPAGGENWFILVNSPPDSGQDWPQLVDELRPRVIERIEASIGRGVAGDLVCERVLTPVDIQQLTGSFRGSLYGVASNSALAAFRRHPNRVPGVRGLYACGGSTHPGGGMPLVLLSAQITTELLVRRELSS